MARFPFRRHDPSFISDILSIYDFRYSKPGCQAGRWSLPFGVWQVVRGGLVRSPPASPPASYHGPRRKIQCEVRGSGVKIRETAASSSSEARSPMSKKWDDL